MNGANSLNDEFNENLFFHWLCTNNLLYINYPPRPYTDKNHKKIWRKRQKTFPNFLKNENIFVKIGELFANFDKKILILRKSAVFFSKFSYDFFSVLKAVVYV